jgi:hypothetical protein
MPNPSATTLSVGSSAANASTYVTGSFAGAANTLVLLACSGHGTTLRSVSSIVGGGASAGWTSVDSATYNTVASPLDRISIWRYLSSSPAAASVATITLTGTNSQLQWIVTQYSNVSTTGTNGAGAIQQSVRSTADTVSAITIPMTSFISTANGAFGGFSFLTTFTSLGVTPGANFKALAETSAGEIADIYSCWTSVNVTNIDSKLTAGTKNAAGIGLEIVGSNPAVAAKGGYYHHYYRQMVVA